MADGARDRGRRPPQSWSSSSPALNCWLSSGSLVAAEIIAAAGFDSILIDMQHTPFEYRDMHAIAGLAACADVAVIARVEWNDRALIGKVLDAGVDGVMCPMINTPAEAREFVAACRYPPLGVRSYGGGYRTNPDPEEANASVIAFAQIETLKALGQADEIASTPGLDAICIGSCDLALDAGGRPVLDTSDPETAERHRRIIDEAHRADTKVGILAGPSQFAAALSWGVDWLSIADDTEMLMTGAGSLIAHARRAIDAQTTVED